MSADLKNNPKAQAELLRQRTTASFPYLIEAVNSDFDSTKRYVNYNENVTFEGKVFEPAYFEFTPPEKSTSGISDAKLSISCIDQEWIKRVRTTQKKTIIRIVGVVIYDEIEGMQISKMDDITFSVESATWSDSLMEFTLKFDEVMDILMPIDVLTPLNCAGCV